jgi:hypothetical protein
MHSKSQWSRTTSHDIIALLVLGDNWIALVHVILTKTPYEDESGEADDEVEVVGAVCGPSEPQVCEQGTPGHLGTAQGTPGHLGTALSVEVFSCDRDSTYVFYGVLVSCLCTSTGNMYSN